MIKKVTSNWVNLICRKCGGDFWVKPYRKNTAKYCSLACKHRTHGETIRETCRQRGTTSFVEKVCASCGKTFQAPIGNINRGFGRYCSRRCYGKTIKGKHVQTNTGKTHFKKKGKHPFWNNGSSFEPYGVEFDEKLREQIRKRDGYVCRECGYTEKELGYHLACHHIDYNKKNNSSNNLISLCKSCHAQTNFNRKDWEKYYQSKLYEY